jgi:branched-chain amino acid transport system substrate-binding protein
LVLFGRPHSRAAPMIVIIDGGGFEALRQGLARAIGGVAIVALIAGAGACNSTTKATSSGKSFCGYDLAFFGALTGSSANLGINIEQGSQLAVNQFNATNGAGCITLEKFDSQGSPTVAPGQARKLVQNKKIIGIVGPAFSGESQVADPIFNDAGIPTITPSATNPPLATGGTVGGTPWKIFHRAVANDDAQGPADARFISEVLKPTRVFVADDQSTYGAGLATAVEGALPKGLVVGTDHTKGDGQQQDFGPTVTKVISSKATVFFYGGYYTNAGLIRKQLTAAGWTGTLMAGDGAYDPGLAKAAGNAAAAGTITSCPCAPTTSETTFFSAYKAAFPGQTAGAYSDVAYDAANMFLKGIAAGNTTVGALNTYIGAIDYKGVANEYKFTANGELDPTLIKIWEYKFDANGVPQALQAAPTS